MARFKILLFLIFIFVIALVFRLYHLSSVPYGFHSDEVFAGFEGSFILKNSIDTYGNFLPLYFDKFGDYRPIGAFLVSGFFNLLFGPSVFATRAGIALFGSATVFVIYKLFKKLYGDQNSTPGALAAAFIAALLPWHIVLSRSTQESVLGLFSMCLGLVFLLSYLKDNRRLNLFFTCVLFFSSYFFYTSHRILVPVVLFGILGENLIWRSGKNVRVLFSIFLAFFVLTLIILATPWGRGRGQQVLIFNNPQVLTVGQNLSFGDGPNNVLTARIFHNKVVVYTRQLVSAYFTYFSGEFLFMQGGLPDRYKIPQQGLLYFSMAPFLILGFVETFRRRIFIPVFLLLTVPIVAVFTFDDVPNVNRVSSMIMPLTLLFGLGVGRAWEFKIKILKFLAFGVLSLVFLLEVIYFGHQYLIHESQNKSFFRNDSYIQAAQYLSENYKNYDSVYASNVDDLLIYFWFWKAAYDKSLRYNAYERPQIYLYENISFIRNDCLNDKLKESNKDGKVLLLNGGDCKGIEGFTKDKEWVRGDSTKAFTAFYKR
ncbi:hypothetical protein A2165_03625 [Candidatus Curtissbacteria bacterium RBG_13_40_7]|uniref:Glycosyltransferase RgtA/B/C/D-like domain-containing protein n=1 Tax=Candidatus Curtissbacteria bacterium RBG_13_40_7 TaxID=1797706 RepID=A0A1F5FXC2_9BACT|nr:MAG: hypothetical protein A2165_03625 [Candidatus Curtissbacteria bacterium RBG_13_40_7]